jgi:uncharacterized protein (DUF952 family)
MSALVFKIAARNEWRAAVARGRYDGSADDRRDGFVHLSAGHQVAETLARHFRAKKNLMLIAFRAEDLRPFLRWEASRGGDLFPHHYGALDPRLALWVRPIAEHTGGHGLPPLGADP